MLKNFKKYIHLAVMAPVVLFGFLILPNITLAATLNFIPNSGSYAVGDTIRVEVAVNSSDQSVNAVSANIKFSEDTLRASSISKARSIINIWPLGEPTFNNIAGTVALDGVSLNGYAGNSGTIITIVFKAKAEGKAFVNFSSASVLANDGNGSEVLTGKGSALLNIVSAPEEQSTVPAPVPSTQEQVQPPIKTPTQPPEQSVKISEVQVESPGNAYLGFIIILLIFIVILLILMVYLRYKRDRLKDRVYQIEDNVTKSFEVLEEDISGMNPPNIKVAKDIRATERGIIKELNDIEKEL